RGRDRVAAPAEGFLHESGLPVVLGAAVRFDVHLPESDGRPGLSLRVARRAPHNSYPRPRRSRRHGATPRQRANVGAVGAGRIPAGPSAEGARARTPGSRQGREAATQGGARSREGDTIAGTVAVLTTLC